ncbi:MAG: bifunctional diaminohydroxyphosphoribosylaminopyrimidine deaminase/5-amino-6-(5-phosphoribosylamino)uracil reductase RibD [Planctomycetaceae bacterium]
MRRAADLALRGSLRVDPNPMVGCVLVRGGRIVAEGFHAAWGGPHAEREALDRAGAGAKGATAYVTLEPCGHQGKTPPCAPALARAAIAEVVFAERDPNSLTAGLGPRQLREAGVVVRRAHSTRATRALLARFRTHLARPRPWVIAKWAMTLEGRLSARGGDSRWVSGKEARAWGHAELRSRVDAILVGGGTLRIDDPLLTNRSGRGGQPLRVVVCGRRPPPRDARLFRGRPPVLWLAPAGTRMPAGVEAVTCGAHGRVDVRRALRLLHRRGIRRILLEGGGALLGSFLDAGLVDQAAVLLAPKLVGGAGAVISGRGRSSMDGASRLEGMRAEALGPDLLVEGYVSRP